jgi:hypothetical protein
MARASNVYVLQRKNDNGSIGGVILAGWTVKYQMEYWLKQRDESRATLELLYQVVRCQDGFGTQNTTIVPWEEIA